MSTRNQPALLEQVLYFSLADSSILILLAVLLD